MANLVVVLFAVAAIIAGAMSLTGAALSSASGASIAWDKMTDRTGDAARTELTLIDADIGATGTDIDISIRNTGQTSLADYSWWDVVIQYYSSSTNSNLTVAWMANTSTAPSTGQWTVQGIYLNASTTDAEVYEPNVFNPGEEMVIRLNIAPVIPTATDNLVTVATPNGIRLSAPFSR